MEGLSQPLQQEGCPVEVMGHIFFVVSRGRANPVSLQYYRDGARTVAT